MQHAGQCRQAERSAWLWATCRTDSTCNLRLRGLAYDSSTILNVVFLFKKHFECPAARRNESAGDVCFEQSHETGRFRPGVELSCFSKPSLAHDGDCSS